MRPTATSLIVIASLTAAGAANAQSFDCRAARFADEQLICTDPHLSKLDEQLAQVFTKAFEQLPAKDQKELADDEEDWVVQRRQCGADARCIAREYRTRLRELTAGVAPPTVTARPNPPPPIAPEPPPTISGPPFPIVPPPPAAVVNRPPQPLAVEQQPAPVGSGTSTGKEEGQERKSASHKVRKATTETSPAEPAVSEPDAEAARITSRPHRKPKQNAAPATAAPNPPRTASATPAPSAGSSAKPSIQWVDPPPAR